MKWTSTSEGQRQQSAVLGFSGLVAASEPPGHRGCTWPLLMFQREYVLLLHRDSPLQEESREGAGERQASGPQNAVGAGTLPQGGGAPTAFVTRPLRCCPLLPLACAAGQEVFGNRVFSPNQP